MPKKSAEFEYVAALKIALEERVGLEFAHWEIPPNKETNRQRRNVLLTLLDHGERVRLSYSGGRWTWSKTAFASSDWQNLRPSDALGEGDNDYGPSFGWGPDATFITSKLEAIRTENREVAESTSFAQVNGVSLQQSRGKGRKSPKQIWLRILVAYLAISAAMWGFSNLNQEVPVNSPPSLNRVNQPEMPEVDFENLSPGTSGGSFGTCADGTTTNSKGNQGACSWHGGLAP